ncbi:unnamed protein product [Tetraodon nigroviridis]|uniref:(spotted green pufferfish) hypothetical protein n=1 Tax=Tetraodon nigroviridis TaxID=99883 RepID=Q4TJE6_TETNG|nr:unnamed protein product [Tetraodon nigroviridis]
MEEEDRAECPVSSCVSLKSDRSKDEPIDFRDEAGPSNPGFTSSRTSSDICSR